MNSIDIEFGAKVGILRDQPHLGNLFVRQHNRSTIKSSTRDKGRSRNPSRYTLSRALRICVPPCGHLDVMFEGYPAGMVTAREEAHYDVCRGARDRAKDALLSRT